ncbi:phosphonopyruvate decarboxylase isoform X3 [Octopus bimaculoides]|uniref:phosphonopyruvate decarboxylase isoform X3 n=1 Tax=Octopus bimaculoides TaxID=37653 RepID=UPI0022E51DB8|nr:phosphonopyruvate decarboxylase isoform X3 [Octopus bimaculoides]
MFLATLFRKQRFIQVFFENTNSLRVLPSQIPCKIKSYKTNNFSNTKALYHTTTWLSTLKSQVAEQQVRNQEVGMMTELVRDFLDPADFYKALHNIGIEYFCGVPDSLLKDFCAYIAETSPKDRHIITANEGSAVALATGYHLATGKSSLVYLQNSGLGNIVNPLMSLASTSVYSIPMLLLVGWRGEPGKRDEPQHLVQGHATPGLLASMGIPFQPLPDYQEGAEQALKTARHYMESSKGPYCLLVRRQTFLPYKLREKTPEFLLTREEAMKIIIDNIGSKDAVVSTTGMLSRELFEYRVEKDMGHERDFLTVGSMGHASAIALGIASQKPNKQVFCLDGDGAVIMHMGALSTIGQRGSDNLKHVIINNGCHDSVGGQMTDAGNHDSFDFCEITKSCGYKDAKTVISEEELKEGILWLRQTPGPALLQVKVNVGGRSNLGRPTRTTHENKADFMHFLAIK